jgi:hypothetical protein
MSLSLSLGLLLGSQASGGGAPPASYDYTITNDGDALTANSFLNVLAQIATDGTGGTVGVYVPSDAAYYDKKTITLSATSATVEFIAAEAGVRIDRLYVYNNAANVSFDGIEIVSYQTPMTEAVVTQESSAGTLTIKNSPRWSGNYNGDTAHNLDPTNSDAYPELGHVQAVVVGGALTGGTVDARNAYIGSNWTGSKTDALNGTITFTINGAGTGAAAEIDVVNGYLIEASFNLISGGSGYSDTSAALASMLEIPGRSTFSDILHYAFQATGTGNGRATFENNVIRTCRRGLVAWANLTAIGNDIDALPGDFIQVAGSGSVPTDETTIIRFNKLSRPMAKPDDYGNPHVDAIQLTASNTRMVEWEIDIEGNSILQGASVRGDWQGILLSDVLPDYGYSGRVCNNIVVSSGAINGILVEEANDLIVFGNIAVRADPSSTDGSTVSVSVGSSAGSVYVGYNIAEAFGAAPSTAKYENNVTVTKGSLASYEAAFVDPDAYPTTVAAAVAAYVSQGPAAGAGVIRGDGAVDLVNETVDKSGEPVFAYFERVTDAAVSTLANSNVARMVGGDGSASFSLTNGFEAQFADDLAFTSNVTTAATSGSFTQPYVRLAYTTGSVGSTTASTVLTLGSTTTEWTVKTVGVLSYTALDNGGTEWSELATFTTGTHHKAVIAMEVKADVLAVKKLLARSSSQDFIGITTGNILQVQYGGGTNLNLRTTDTLSTDWVRIIIIIDMAAGLSGCNILLNNTLATINSSTSTVNTGGSLALGTIFGTGLGLLATNSGTDILNGQFRFLYWHSWTGAGPTLPDVSTQAGCDALYDAFSADLIDLTDGSGPLGVQPLGFWTATDLTEANSVGGIPNRGSVGSAAFVKQSAGSYA